MINDDNYSTTIFHLNINELQNIEQLLNDGGSIYELATFDDQEVMDRYLEEHAMEAYDEYLEKYAQSAYELAAEKREILCEQAKDDVLTLLRK